jgi:hypothetical protein
MDAFREMFAPLNLPEGKIAFYGTVRVGDRGANEVHIELNGRAPLFGEWSQWYHKNEKDFDAKIVSFGFGSSANVGNPYPNARLEFSLQEKRDIEKLILSIFERKLLKLKSGNRESSIFTGKAKSFSGNVIFGDDWIRVQL